ncbi:MAG TPA: GNAT family N-acetyltransferase [Candidatus Saccharimonadales bacterium]|nr:GNAT family N-acetyltransferase [Candidatus Saccharimonadales bacterium]
MSEAVFDPSAESLVLPVGEGMTLERLLAVDQASVAEFLVNEWDGFSQFAPAEAGESERDGETKAELACRIVFPGNPEDFNLAIKQERRLIGLLFLDQTNIAGLREIGYVLGKDYRKQGRATRAVGAAIKFAFTGTDAVSLSARTLKDNVASQRVLLKNGFQAGYTGGKIIYFGLSKQRYLDQAADAA